MTHTAKKTNLVENLIFSMFTENTGRHFLDSGGAYGRNWERNANFTLASARALPTVAHEIYEYKDGKCELNVTVNVFKYLLSADLEIDEICKKFNRMQSKHNNWDFGDLYGVSFEAGEYLQSVEANISESWNTYNDSVQWLSQVLQGAYIEIAENRYVCLQIHGGCDVRGGYTDAKLFKLGYWSEGYLPIVDIYGTIDGVRVDNMYNGHSFTDEDGNEVEIKPDSIVELDLLSR